MIKLDNKEALSFVEKIDLEKAKDALNTLISGSGAGAEFTGWLNLPQNYDKEEYTRLKATAAKIYKADALVVIGIGGSYLGARAAIEFLLSQRYNEVLRKGPKIYFVGNGMSGEDIKEVLSLVGAKNTYVNVISKSGTTLECAAAFRIFKKYLEETYGKDGARERIICTTDKSKGVLKKLADEEGYECFVVPDNIGGRFSVLTSVGLLPIAAAGIDIDKIMEGAASMMSVCSKADDNNPALLYAATRQALYKSGKKIEILSCPNESTRFFAEWWKQLFGESEGKDKKGIFPASCVFTADLHSMGQYIQDGERILMESFLSFEKPKSAFAIPAADDNKDGLSYLEGKDYRDLYRAAEEGTKKAHKDGQVPCMTITAEKQDEKTLGELIYFFEIACAISAYMEGVNPFNQPGVEEYKKNMFALLGRR